MAKLRYVLEIDTQRVPHELVRKAEDGTEMRVSAEAGQHLLSFLTKANMSYGARNDLEHKASVKILKVEVVA